MELLNREKRNVERNAEGTGQRLLNTLMGERANQS